MTGARTPLICGPMYPCSNPELVGAAARAGAVAIFQPLSLTFVHGHKFDEGVTLMQSIAGPGGAPLIGCNMLIEKSSSKYLKQQEQWLDQALHLDVKIFVTSLGNPDWVVKRARQAGALVFHDVTNRKWALKAMEADVDGLIAVNNRAGGHAGEHSPEQLLDVLAEFGKPVVAAGGVGSPAQFKQMLDLRSGDGQFAYAGVQCGTRFLATTECSASNEYKQAIVAASETDVYLTKKLTGVNVSVLARPDQPKQTEPSRLVQWFLNAPQFKHVARAYLSMKTVFDFKKQAEGNDAAAEWQAGKSAGAITSVEPVAKVVSSFHNAVM